MENSYVKKSVKLGDSEIISFLRSSELPFLAYLNPWIFIFEVLKGANRLHIPIDLREYVFNAMQGMFARMCYRLFQWGYEEEYLRGFIRTSLFHYLVLRNVYRNNNWVTKKELLIQGLPPEFRVNCALVLNDSRNMKDYYGMLICTHDDLKQLIKTSGFETKEVVVPNPELFDRGKYSDSWGKYDSISTLQGEMQKLTPYLDLAFVHGSFATQDFAKGSDLDCAVFLNPSVFQDTKTVERVSKELTRLSLIGYKIDVMAHHRLSIFTDVDLMYYPESRTPKVLFEYGVSLWKRNEQIRINLRNDDVERMQDFWSRLYYFRNKLRQNNFSTNILSWKADVSHITFVPALALQAIDIHVYKKYSFDLVKEHFPNVDWSIIDEASQYRNEWGDTINLLRYYPNRLIMSMPYRVNKAIYERARMAANKKTRIPDRKVIEVFTRRAYELLERVWEEILRRKGVINA
ncbi:nucleotidyltransferase domain-containing protein [Chloroflexota bacterium]